MFCQQDRIAPLVLISACLIGHSLRYKGDHKLQPLLAQMSPTVLRWLPVCPEVAAGFGVPRPPMRLRRHQGQTCLVRCHDSAELTEKLRIACRALVHEARKNRICGAVLKSRSPSCAPGNAPFFDASGNKSGQYGFGIFAEMLHAAKPGLPLIDEEGMADPDRQAFFLQSLIRSATQLA